MKLIRIFPLRRLVAAMFVGCSPAIAVLRAQIAAPPPATAAATKAETVVMSPFVIEVGTDTGYLASTTLSGSRLKTDYRDVASQVSVMTPEFLADIGAFTADEAFNYSLNTETGMELAGVEAQFFGLGAASNTPPNRTRGLDGATPTRNFFATSIPYDSYNAFEGGLTMASGPNAGLFGLGSPAGITDTQFNRAQLGRTKARARVVVDSHGSRRVDVDYNRPIIPQVLAVRLDGLFNDKRYAFDGYYSTDKRITGGIGWSPFKKLRVDVFSEYVDRRASLPVYLLPKDSVTPWTNPGMGNRKPFTTPDQAPDAQGLALNPGSNAYLLPFTGSTGAVAYTFGSNVTPGVYNYNYSAAVRPLGTYLNAGLASLPTFNAAATFTDDQVYPFDRLGLFGPTHPNFMNGRSITALSNLQLSEHLFLEIGANYEATRLKAANMFAATQANLNVDPNSYRYRAGYIPLDPTTAGAALLPNRAANASNRENNPAFGSLYLEGRESATLAENSTKEVRLALAYEFDASRRFGKFGAYLGRHRFLGTASTNEVSSVNQLFGRLILDDVDPNTGRPVAPGVITAAASKAGFSPTARYMNTLNRQFVTRQYIDPNDPASMRGSFGGLDPFNAWTFTDANGRPYRVGLFEQGGNNPATGRRTADFSRAFVYQGYFLRDRLVLTYSRRYDTTRTKELDATTNQISPLTGLAPNYAAVPWERFETNPLFLNTSKSAVLHAAPWLSFHYNVSTNNDPTPSTAHNIDGSLYDFPSGDNKEYGLRLSAGGVSLRVNRYKTAMTSLDAGNTYGNATVRRTAFAQEGRYIDLQRTRALALGLPDFNDFYKKSATAPGFNASDNLVDFYRLYADSVARGTEIELSGRWRKLDLRVAVGRTDAVKSNIGTDWLNYAVDPVLFRRMQSLEWYALDTASNRVLPVIGVGANSRPVFGAPGAAPIKGWENIPTNDTGSTTTLFTNYRNTLLPQVLGVRQLEGISNPGVREWRFSSTVACNMGQGWRIGFSTRLRAKAMIGNLVRDVTVDIAGNTVSTRANDVSQRYYSPDQWYFDPFVSYKAKLGQGRGVTLQLNVRNALNNRDLLVTQVAASTANRADPNDARYVYYGWKDASAIPSAAQLQDPREFQLSATFDF